MSVPSTKVPILTGEEYGFLENAKQDYETSYALKTGGRGSTDKNNFLKCVTKFAMAMTLALYSDARFATDYDFAQSTVEATRFLNYENLYKKICIHLLISEDQLNLERRIFGFGLSNTRRFWQEYVVEGLLAEYGGDPAKGINLMTILCTTIKTEGKEAQFNHWSGSSIKQLGDDAVSEFRAFEKKFRATLGPDGKPASGKTWQSALEDFRGALYEEAQEQKRQKKTAKQSAVEGEEEEVLHPSSDLFDQFAITSQNVPDGWLPGGAHTWLLFVCFGTYGQTVYDTDRPNTLHMPAAAKLEQIKTGRRENKKLATKQSCPTGSSASYAEEFRLSEIRQSMIAQFEKSWEVRRSRYEYLISNLEKKMDTGFKCLSLHVPGTREHDEERERLLQRRTEIDDLTTDCDTLINNREKEFAEFYASLDSNVRRNAKKLKSETEGELELQSCPSPVAFNHRIMHEVE